MSIVLCIINKLIIHHRESLAYKYEQDESQSKDNNKTRIITNKHFKNSENSQNSDPQFLLNFSKHA